MDLPPLHVRRLLHRLLPGLLLDLQHRHARIPPQRLRTDHAPRPAVAHHMGQPLRRQRRIQRHVHSRRLQRAQQPHGQRHRAWCVHRHTLLRPHPQRLQPRSQRLSRPLQLRVAQAAVLVYHRLLFPRMLHRFAPPAQHQLRLFRLRLRLHRDRAMPRHLTQPRWRIVGERLGNGVEQGVELIGDPMQGRLLDAAAVVQVIQARHRAGAHTQRERIVIAIVRLHWPERKASRRVGLQHLVNRIVFEHDDAVEQALARHTVGALDIRQGCVLVLARLQALRLHVLHPTHQRAFRARDRDHRHGIDEQAHRLANLRQFRGTACGRGTEHHRHPADQRLQGQRPRRLDGAVDRHALAPRGRGQPGRARCAQLDRMAAIPPPAIDGTQVFRQPGGFFQHTEQRLPIPCSRLCVLAFDPGQVIAVTPHACRQRFTGVMAQHVAQQQGSGPAVHQQVVVGPDEVVCSRGQAHQHHAHERRLGQVEALRGLCTRQCIERIGTVLPRAPVLHFQGNGTGLIHPLQAAFAHQEAAAKGWMAVQHRRPCGT
ncbi:hypothetical protein ACAN107058_23275 [Paracidovorax anthurii]